MGQCVSKESKSKSGEGQDNRPKQAENSADLFPVKPAADNTLAACTQPIELQGETENEICHSENRKSSQHQIEKKPRASLKETLIRAMSNPNVEMIDPEEVNQLRERLEQAEWQLLDIKALTSSDVYQLIANIMKQIDDFEDAQLSVSNSNHPSQDGTLGKSETGNADQAAVANSVFQTLMRFRQQGHSIYNDVNDEVIAQSGLDSLTKKWLTNEFTRASIVRPARHSMSIGDSKPLNVAPYEVLLSPEPPFDICSVSSDAIFNENFDVFDYEVDQLVHACVKIFELGNCLHSCEIDPRSMLPLIDQICKGYVASNPFHNFFHATDVLHSCFIILHKTDFDIIMAPWQKLGLFLAAVAHDVGHPGTNNAFQVNTSSKLALLYNDQSVLENHHAAMLYRIISDHGERIFRNLKPYARSDMRSVILTSIMATDMKYHFDLVAKGDMTFEKVKMYKKHALGAQNDASSSALSPPPTSVDEARKKEVKLALNLILHCADINNVYKTWPAAKRWSDLVVEEFYAQGDMERKLRIPISPFMDRSKDSQAQMSLNFIDFIAGPLVACLADSFQTLEFMLRNMVEVRTNWHTIRKKELQNLENPIESDEQLALLRSRENEFVRNYVSRVLHHRSSVTRTFAMLSAGNNAFGSLTRRNSTILSKDIETANSSAIISKGTLIGDKSKSDNDLRRSSSAEDVFTRASRQWTLSVPRNHMRSV